jgi:hypothetical protein
MAVKNMVKRPKQNRKKMVRLKDRDIELIGKMKEWGLSTRIIGRAMNVTHPAVLYILNKVERNKKEKI